MPLNQRDTLVLARGQPSEGGWVMELREALAMHPASLPSPDPTDERSPARDARAMHPGLPSTEAENLRDSLAMHPAHFPLRERQLLPTAKAA